jgi:hypothetical protein
MRMTNAAQPSVAADTQAARLNETLGAKEK